VFSMTAGVSTQVTQQLTVAVPATAPATVFWKATTSTSSGGNWLLADIEGTAYPAGTPNELNVLNVTAYSGAAGTYAGTVTISGAGASNSPVSIPVTMNVKAPLALNGISPNTIAAGSPSFLLTANGAGFLSGAAIQWNGAALASNYLSSTQLTAAVPASLVAASGTANVTVVNPGGPVAGPATFVIGSVAPPKLISITPNSATAGEQALSLSAYGSGFLNGASVVWNGSSLATTFVSSSYLYATLPAGLIASPASATITVQNPGNGTSNSLPFTVHLLTPAVAGLLPQSATAGGGAFSLNVLGQDFDTGSKVLWNGSALATTYINDGNTGELSALVPAALIVSPGTANITVQNTDGVISNALSFTISPATPVLTSTFPTGEPTAGAASFTLTANGTGFLSGSQILWNGSPLTTTYVDANHLTTMVPANLVASQGTVSLSVKNPNGATSNSLTFTIGPPAPTLTSLSPSSSVAGGSSFTLMLNGSGFLSGATVLWNGGTLATAFLGATQLHATVPVSLIASPGSAVIYVQNPNFIASNRLILYINAPNSLTIVTPPQLPGGVVGFFYATPLDATGGAAPYQGWSVSSGSTLPPGISLNSGSSTTSAGLNGRPTSAGTFRFTLEVTDSAGSAASQQFTMGVTGTENSIVSAASYSTIGVAPGEIVTIFGTFAGPSSLVGLSLDGNGNVSTNLAGSQVLFNGVGAPMIYAVSGQLSCVVPYEVAVGAIVDVQILYQGQVSASGSVNIVASAPGVFTVDASGSGQGSILNQDSSLNSPSNPAARGSIVSVYATGEGQTNPPGVDGKPDGSPAPVPAAQPVTAMVGGLPANVVYAGGAPGLVAGVLQVNVQIPQSAMTGGAVPITISVGGVVSQANVTLAIK
jgi:uncharacterized protein (TIGR03437 family)